MLEETKNFTKSEDLVISYYLDVVKYLGKFGLEKDDLEDAIELTMLKAIKKVGTIRDEEKTKAWLIKIARNVGLDYKRKYASGRNRQCAFWEDVLKLSEVDQYENDVLDTLIQNADNSLLEDCMMKLSEKERKIIWLQYAHNEKLKNIALIVDENVNNVKSISHRAKKKLEKFLIEGGYEHGK